MRKLVYLIGEPSSGKSTVVRRISKGLGVGKSKKFKLVNYREYPEKLVMVIGDYTNDADPFPGPDKFSFSAIDSLRELMVSIPDGWSILAEGDRLATAKLFQYAKDLGYGVEVVHLVVGEPSQSERNKLRAALRWNANPDSPWMKGRRKKYANLARDWATASLQNNDETDLTQNVDHVSRLLVVG